MRPLLPRPGPPALPLTPSGSALPIPPIQKTLTACNECRHKKTKCDGERPACLRCRRAGATCVYANDSAVVQNAIKRKYRELQEASDTQLELINILRTREQYDAQAVLQRLRAGESVEALVRFIKHGDLLLQCRKTTASQVRYSFPMISTMPPCLDMDGSPYTRSLLYQRTFVDQPQPGALNLRALPIHEKRYDWPYHAAELVESSLDTVRASTWTAVTDSDDLVRTLLKAYLYYDFPSNSLFHKDAFLVDLAAGRRTYCSPLLVNAVLACACHCFRTPASSIDFWNPKELIYQFTAEAKRLWEREQARNHITTVQAGAIIGYSLNCDGLDKIGFRYLRLAISMAKDMGLFSPQPRAVDSKRQAVFSATAWGLFDMQARQTFLTRQPSLLVDPPPVTWTNESLSTYYFGELWVLYPQAPYPTPVYHSQVFSATCELASIMNDIVIRTYGPSKQSGPISFREALGFRDRLRKWQAMLPIPLQPESAVFPAQLKLHMQFCVLLIFLLGRFSAVERSAAELGITPGDMTTAQAITSSAKTSLESLLYLYYARHSFEKCDTAMMAYFDLMGFGALKDMGHSNQQARMSKLSMVVLCAKGLRDQARNFFVAEVIFAILRDSLSYEDARQLKQFACIENEEKRKPLLAEHVFSHYPLTSTDLYDVADQRRLDELVKSYEVLDIDDDDKDKDNEMPVANDTDGTDGIDGLDRMDGVDDTSCGSCTSR
ncbi:C6 transcription factor [Seiridium cupressi]